MNDTPLKEKITQYLAENPQYVGSRQARELAGHPQDRSQIRAALVERGFAVGEKHGELVITNALISPEWRTGGMDGGSCWGGEANRPVQGDEEPAWLEEFLEKVAPEVSFLKFRRMRQKCTKYEFTQNEYYGNYTYYAFEVLKLDDIVAVLDA